MKRGLLVTAALMLAAASHGARAEVVDEWRFRVLLEGREIGHHRYTLRDEGGQFRLDSEADFEVRMLFVTLYRYRHVAEEVWRDDCLASVTAATDANGEPSRVQGQREGDAFRVVTEEGADELPACIMSFAYWNPEFLRQDRLLNPQTGDYLDVRVSEPVAEDLSLGGRRVDATRYRLTAGDMDITLWYSGQGDWLALETLARGGRVLRYEREWPTEPLS